MALLTFRLMALDLRRLSEIDDNVTATDEGDLAGEQTAECVLLVLGEFDRGVDFVLHDRCPFGLKFCE
jgi:hypothetical protein